MKIKIDKTREEFEQDNKELATRNALMKIRRGNRFERRQRAKKLRQNLKKKGLSRDYAVDLSKRIVKKHG